MAFLILLKYMVLTKSSIAIIFTAKNTKFNDKKKESVTGYNSGPKKNLSGLQSNEKKYFVGQIKIIETRGRTKEIGEKEKLTLLV